MNQADYDAMSPEERERWLAANLPRILADSTPDPTPGEVSGAENEVLKVTTVRLPVGVLAAVDALTHGARDGRSGFIRDAIQEKLERGAA